MAITKDQAMALRKGDMLHDDVGCPVRLNGRGRDMGPAFWKVSGKTQTWVTRPDDFRVPIKHGLYLPGDVTPSWNHVHTEADCPRVTED